MIGDVSRAEHIYIVCGYTDMRKSIDGLAVIIQQNLGLDVFSGSLFLFCGKRCDRIKALLWEELSAGFCYPHIFFGIYLKQQEHALSLINIRITKTCG